MSFATTNSTCYTSTTTNTNINTKENLMLQYAITTAMPGYLSESDAEPFEATPGQAIDALIDEADFQLGDEPDDDDEALISDRALVEQYRGAEGRGDLLANLIEWGEASIWLESYANGFGGTVRVVLVDSLGQPVA